MKLNEIKELITFARDNGVAKLSYRDGVISFELKEAPKQIVLEQVSQRNMQPLEHKETEATEEDLLFGSVED